MKTRLLGAAVLFALAVLFLPMIFNGKPPTAEGDQAVSLAIPPSPDRDLKTRTMNLAPDAAVSTTSAPAAAASANTTSSTSTAAPPASGDQLARVNIGSSRPRDVETDPEAGKRPVPTTVTTDSVTAKPVIPMQAKQPPVVAPVPRQKPALPAAAKPAAAPVARAADDTGRYTLDLSAYASATGAANLQRRVRALGYPVTGYPITQAGQRRTLVIAGPFGTRTAAEAARLKIAQSIPGTPVRLQQGASRAGGTVAASPTPAGGHAKAGGWAVQVVAMSNKADAMALRDKLRSNGFDGFVDSVQSGGRRLWRVRVGPQTQRTDAQRVHDQIKAKLNIDGNVVPVP
ncbi:MAG: SPOR domain-containing protein [Rhodanobacter sp.]|nr:SPOR domain-containing protein [Rhodanobacter sp.]